MSPEEAQRMGYKVKLMNPKAGISLGLEGLEDFIKQQIANGQPDYKALTEAVRSIVTADNKQLIEAIRSISLNAPESGDMQVMVEAFKALQDLTTNVDVTVQAPNVPRRIIVSADVEHEVERGVMVLKKINFNYGEEAM